MLEADPKTRINSKEMLDLLKQLKEMAKKEPPNSQILNSINEPPTMKNSLPYQEKKPLKKIEHSNGTYEGEFIEENIRHGEGSFKSSFGDHYMGSWKNNKMHGKGKIILSSGDIYEGDWIDGKRSGEGKLTTARGDVYSGSWQNDCYHGNGKMKYSNGNIYYGQWIMGKRSGKGHMTYLLGRRKSYDGEWANDLENGEAVCVMRDNSIYSGRFSNGSNLNQEGVFIYYQNNVKKLYEGRITNDVQIIPVQNLGGCSSFKCTIF